MLIFKFQNKAQGLRQNFYDAGNILPVYYWRRVMYIGVLDSVKRYIDFMLSEKNENVFLLNTFVSNGTQKRNR